MDTLARRFTIICLIMALFGMGLASLVARADQPMRDHAFDAGCRFSYSLHC